MKIENIVKSKFQQVSDILEKDGDISDTQTVKIWGDESGIYKVGEHIRKYRKLKADRNFFAGKKIVEKNKAHRMHLVRVDGETMFYKIGKEFYNEVEI